MIIFLRVLLLLAPIVALFMYMRWRAKKNAGEEISDSDVRQLKFGLAGLIIILLGAGIALRMTDLEVDAGRKYVPPHIENGKAVPGHFVDDEETLEDASGEGENTSSDPSDKSSG